MLSQVEINSKSSCVLIRNFMNRKLGLSLGLKLSFLSPQACRRQCLTNWLPYIFVKELRGAMQWTNHN